MWREFYNWAATSLKSIPLDEMFFDKSCAISEHIPWATVHFLHKIKMYLNGGVDHKPSWFKTACGDGREFGFAFL